MRRPTHCQLKTNSHSPPLEKVHSQQQEPVRRRNTQCSHMQEAKSQKAGNGHRTQGNSYVYWFIIKNTSCRDTQDAVWKCPKRRLLLQQVGKANSWHVDVLTNQKLSDPSMIGMFIKASLHEHDWSFVPFPASPLLCRKAGGTGIFKLLFTACSFWRASLPSGAYQGSPH